MIKRYLINHFSTHINNLLFLDISINLLYYKKTYSLACKITLNKNIFISVFI